MEGKNHSSSLQDERGKTDESLSSERGKTDDSLALKREETKSVTDNVVQRDRDGADQARATSRERTDAKTEENRDGRTKEGKNRTSGEIKSDQLLNDQRNRADAAVTSERSVVDAAMVLERDINVAGEAKFLESERNQTDLSLSRERAHTDSEAFVSSILLKSEVSSHKATQELLTSRDEFLAIFSHDLRNPVGAILTLAQQLLDGEIRSAIDIKIMTEAIEKSAAASFRLIDDIVDMEKFAVGKLVLKFAPCDVDDLIRGTAKTFLTLASARKIELMTQAPEGVLLINCDQTRIKQVLINLIGNALKFTPAGGQVVVKTARTEKELLVSIADTGCGIPLDQRKRIFGRYTQLGKKNREGLGLGLYISKMLVEAHDGKIGLISTEGAGSTFTFTIPLKRSTPIGGLI